MLAGAGLREEGVEGVVASADGLVGGHLAVRLDAVLKAQKLPRGITALYASLSKVNSDALWEGGGELKNKYVLILNGSGCGHHTKVIGLEIYISEN